MYCQVYRSSLNHGIKLCNVRSCNCGFVALNVTEFTVLTVCLHVWFTNAISSYTANLLFAELKYSFVPRNSVDSLLSVSGCLYTCLYGTCRASLHRWGMAQSDLCQCGQRQTMTHLIDDCPQTKFAGGLEALHEADDDAVHWLQNTATKAFAK